MRAAIAGTAALLAPHLLPAHAAAADAAALARVKNAFTAGLIGDALALGGHYEYDAARIRRGGGFASYSPPGEANHGVGWGAANYHPGKGAGDLTDAGEVAIMLLDHLAELKARGALAAYSFDSYAAHWEARIAAATARATL